MSAQIGGYEWDITEDEMAIVQATYLTGGDSL